MGLPDPLDFTAAGAVRADNQVPPLKRALDLLVAMVALVVTAPVMVAAAIAIRLDSPGPALFLQERTGRGGRSFRLWKFRSMYRDCDDRYHRQLALKWFDGTPTGSGYKPNDDPRITRVGRLLRRTCVDELPQLFNVLAGDMSIVGPRPAIPYERQLYEGWYFEREQVNPGITGLWQVAGRENVPAQTMVLLDILYLRQWSLWLDLKIIAFTIPTLLGHAMPRLVGRRLRTPPGVLRDDSV